MVAWTLHKKVDVFTLIGKLSTTNKDCLHLEHLKWAKCEWVSKFFYTTLHSFIWLVCFRGKGSTIVFIKTVTALSNFPNLVILCINVLLWSIFSATILLGFLEK